MIYFKTKLAYEKNRQREGAAILYGMMKKNPAIKKAVESFQLEFIDEETGEYLSTSDILNQEKNNNMAFSKGKKTTTTGAKANDSAPKKTRHIPEGIFIYNPSETAPAFVLGKIQINLDKFEQWLNDNQDKLRETEKYGQILTLELKRAPEDKDGKSYLYVNVDTYGTEAHEE